jgi:S-adenosylmethionine:tRNA ribosyltransferase-isomerase
MMKHSMDQVHNISTQDYNYTLPEENIAIYGLKNRDDSRLLTWKNGTIEDHNFQHLPDLLPKNAMLVFNNTQVINARLFFNKSTGAKIELFCLEPIAPNDYALSFSQNQSCRWKCLVGNLKRWRDEILVQTVQHAGSTFSFSAKKIQTLPNNAFEIEFQWDNPGVTFGQILEYTGNLPIPPYLNRESEEADLTRYQTVYAKVKGSVAAPTAGLHFTPSIFEALKKGGINCREITLHVGAGTFQPVKTETIGGHTMHAEQFTISKEFVAELTTYQGPIIAVGTTAVRTLESLYFLGCMILNNPQIKKEELNVQQWDPYQKGAHRPTAKEAFQALLNYLQINHLDNLNCSTQIIIAPGYTFNVITGMITNFHQPQSTLLLLIAAFLGDDWKKIYHHALSKEYRFLSFGDSNLYFK